MQCDRPMIHSGLFSAVCAVVAGATAHVPALSNELTAQVNNCPRIFYEEPFNSSAVVPPGCPPNAASSPMPAAPETPLTPDSTAPLPDGFTSPPTPEQLGDPAATVIPIDGAVTVRLINGTAAVINYQVIEDTELRSLPGESEVTLQGLTTPVTITFYREDSGLLTVTPVAIADPGVLEVTLDETTDLGEDETVLQIQETGSVFLN
jgi:hypothetical protein